MHDRVPSYEFLMRPLLEQLADGQERALRDVTSAVAEALGLTEEQRQEVVPSGKVTVVRSRVGWASTYLYQAGAVQRPRRGVLAITERGSTLLDTTAGPISSADLTQFPEFTAFKSRSRSASDARGSDDDLSPSEPANGLTPHERAQAAAAEAEAEVARELLSRLLEQPPAFLERVVLQVLLAMGYGGADGDAEQLGRSGDEGVDGVLRQDPLGLDLVYVQAKRYAPDRSIGRPDLQGFVGALQGAQASRGVFITTSSFTREAQAYAEKVTQRVILIDGDRLTKFMVKHGVGTQVQTSLVLSQVDEDFFDG